MADLATVFVSQKLESGASIFNQGDVPQHMMFVVSGTAVLFRGNYIDGTGKRGSNALAVMGQGKSFGEIALLEPDQKLPTSVQAEDECELMLLPRRGFEEVLERWAEVNRKLPQASKKGEKGTSPRSKDNNASMTPRRSSVLACWRMHAQAEIKKLSDKIKAREDKMKASLSVSEMLAREDFEAAGEAGSTTCATVL